MDDIAKQDGDLKTIIQSPEADNIALMVGERYFYTTRSTLCRESRFFRRYFCDAEKEDRKWGSAYFLDADAFLFDYVLRYLRHGIFPVIYSRGSGHDHAAYAGLVQLATELEVHRLETWLRERKYRAAIMMEYTHVEYEVRPDTWKMFPTISQAAVIERECHVQPHTRKVYRCPFRVASHTSPEMCGWQCDAARDLSGESPWVEEEVLSVRVVERLPCVDLGVCLKDW